MLTVFGTIALDTTRTPEEIVDRTLGGAATFAAISASYYVRTCIVGVVGNDFPAYYRKLLNKILDTSGIVTRTDAKSFHYDSSFDYDLIHRTTNITELNAVLGFRPQIPDEYIDSEFIYLANNDPVQNIEILKLFSSPKLVICDTIDYWIVNKKQKVLAMMKKTDGVIINEQEARLLCNNNNLLKCGKILVSLGPEFVVIKKGENGAILFHENEIYPIAAFPTEFIKDPTGAGDSFAGAFIGYLARRGKRTSRMLKTAVMHGNVMGSFAIEGFGLNSLLKLNRKKILKRYSTYSSMLRL
jgi:sugar/nucleoside kinase (ribokinase family)